MITWKSPRSLGAAFLAFGSLMLFLTYAGIYLIHAFTPLPFLIGVWLVVVGAYQIVTDVSTILPPEQIPRWWLPGLLATSLLALGGAVGFMAYAGL